MYQIRSDQIVITGLRSKPSTYFAVYRKQLRIYFLLTYFCFACPALASLARTHACEVHTHTPTPTQVSPPYIPTPAYSGYIMFTPGYPRILYLGKFSCVARGVVGLGSVVKASLRVKDRPSFSSTREIVQSGLAFGSYQFLDTYQYQYRYHGG